MQGLAHIFDAFTYVSIDNVWMYLTSLFVNIFQGAQGFANALLIMPDYSDQYKLLSFSPLVSALDGFDHIRYLDEIRINRYVPISALSQIWHFGMTYTVIFFFVVFVWLRGVTKVYSRFSYLAMPLVLPSYWICLMLTQYSLRTSWRWILVITLCAWVLILLQKRRIKIGYGIHKNVKNQWEVCAE